jgi:phosphate transport system protein
MTRAYFTQALRELRDQIITMGSHVGEELKVAMRALATLDADQAQQVNVLDRAINDMRFAIEDQCFLLLATQSPAASDLRLVFSAVNMIVDLERMGDQAKGIAKTIPELAQHPDLTRPYELQQMGDLVSVLLSDAMTAYAEDNLELASTTAQRDGEVDALYARVFTNIMFQLAEANTPERVQAVYELLRVARELERFGDLVTNVAERSVYLITGQLPESNPYGPLSGRKV